MATETQELTQVQTVLDGLSSPTDEQFVQAVRAYSDGAVASAAAKRGLGGGGGGSLEWEDVGTTVASGGLPDWWTVDSTSGSESVTFDGQVVINGADPLTNGSNLIIKAGPGSSDNDTDIIYIKDEFGLAVVTITANGGFRTQETVGGEDGVQFITAVGDRWDFGGFSSKCTFLLTGPFTINALPTADPVAAHQLWNDGGTVKVSAG